MVPIKSPRSQNNFKMWWTVSKNDVLVLSELVHDMEQVLIQDETLLQVDTSETVDLSGWTCQDSARAVC